MSTDIITSWFEIVHRNPHQFGMLSAIPVSLYTVTIDIHHSFIDAAKVPIDDFETH